MQTENRGEAAPVEEDANFSSVCLPLTAMRRSLALVALRKHILGEVKNLLPS